MALGTQQVPIRTGILVHQHQEADEVLYVLEGTGYGMLSKGSGDQGQACIGEQEGFSKTFAFHQLSSNSLIQA